MKRILILALGLTLMTVGACAQRKTDKLDRGLVAVAVGGNTYISWRRLAEEYYDVTYNVYSNDVKIAEGLTVSNYTYATNSSNTYKVRAVVNGVEQSPSKSVTPWGYADNSSGCAGYIDLTLHSPIYARDGQTDMTDQYIPNDIEMADLDGDGQLDILLKRKSVYDETDFYLQRTTEATKAYDRIEAYKMDVHANNKLTLLWWIDVGPNMVSGNSTELNMLAFDWDKDGAAEVLLRGANGMIIHYLNNGVETGTQVIGDNPYEDTRNDISHFANATYTWSGAEYLLYLNGRTGVPYPIGNNNKLWMDYPLKRLEHGETDVPDAWWYSAQYNGGKTGILGHRDSKYFFGAPYLDGHNPSIFLARGIYTRHKMIAYDVDANHKLTERWRWDCNDRNSPWFGQGYHNYIVADVDEDGRDEIVYGSMVIDDNGKGLHTTGYGHGDAQHVRDFDPYRKGLEMFACLEEYPNWGSNYRNASTGEIYYKYTSPVTYTNGKMDDHDDGRCLAGNFFNDIPGSLGRSVGSGLVGLSRNVNGKAEELFSHDEAEPWVDYSWLNFRLYWDGDLLDEILDSPAGGTADNHAGAVIKYDRVSTNGKGTRLFNADGSLLNNSTKNNPCFLGDILGDWREEFILRTSPTTMRLYTTVAPTTYPIYTLWHDHQYRQAMSTQMQVYNLPPNPSFFLGEMEGITMAPPPLTNNGRTVIGNNTTIDNSYNGQHLLHNEYANTSLSISGGVPDVLTINVPAWVQGHDNNNNITTITYTCTLSDGALSGSTRLVKQGNGILNMGNTVHSHTGETNIWGGTVEFNGTMQNSHVWMNRHTVLNTTDSHFNNGLTMEYDATLNIGGASMGTVSSVDISTLTMNYGSRVVLDVNGSDDTEHDWLNVTILNVDDSKVGIAAWEDYGPEHIAPVIELRMRTTLGNGIYPIGHVATVNGDLSKVKLVCNTIIASYLSLIVDDGMLCLQVSDVPVVNDASFEITGMESYDNDYFLPVVGIMANNTNGLTPTLTGKFIALDGTVTNVGSKAAETLYSEEFEGSTNSSDYWKNGNGGIYSPCYTNSDGQCIGIVSSADRGDYITFDVDYTDVELYHIDFDVYFNNASKTTDFVVMSQSHEASWVYNWGYDWFTTSKSGHNPFLIFIRRGESSTSFTVNETAQTMTLNNSTWYHFTLTVDVQNGSVDYVVTQKGSSSVVSRGSYTLPEGESAACDGFYIRNGRYNYEPGGAGIDNIIISTPESSFDSYTFTKPGTLEVTSSLEGYASSTKSFEVLCPYIKVGNTGNITIDYIPECSHNESGITTNMETTPFFINSNDVMYDLQGRKLQNGSVAKGIYILGNKKVVR